ncbi:MAG: glucosamine-6-phosphate deaminase [Leptolyngbya sp. SIO4C1]|nr:glucosamine-6-phosphate deaminase [Leptolyngbya sp. SIO4C1]
MTLIRTFSVDALCVEIYDTPAALAEAGARQLIEQLAQALTAPSPVGAVFATGNSQLPLLKQLRYQPEALDWSRVIGFHLDEYLGLAANHPASFQHYLLQQIAQALPFGAFHYLQGDALEPIVECDRYEQLLRSHRLAAGLLGIGRNGHLAFNEPSVARPGEPRWVKLVRLAPQNQQQVGSGSFSSRTAVPEYAYTLTLSALFGIQRLICLAWGEAKASIVKTALESPVRAACPASQLRRHPQATLLLDCAAAGQLS